MPHPARKLTHDGKTLTLKEWAKITGLNVETIRSRIDHLGFSVADALTLPASEKFRPRQKPLVGPKPCPPLKHHVGRDLACVRWQAGGKEQIRYFGKWGSPE